MEVISDCGLKIGRVMDVIFDEKDGRIVSLVVKPSTRDALSGTPKDAKGNFIVPFSSVVSVRDLIVVNEKVLVTQQVRSGPPPEV